MSHIIHARKTRKDEKTGGDVLQFRVWSTNSDSYVSKEMTEAELRERMLKAAVCDAIEQYFSEIDGRIQRALETGTSSQVDDVRDLNASWDKERA